VSDPAAEEAPRKRPWLAAVLTVLIPGLGHLYLRLWGRALLWFLVVIGSVFVLVPEWFSAESLGDLTGIAEGIDPLTSLALLGMSALCVVDAYLMANRYNERARRQHDDATTSCPECGRELDGDLDFCHWCTARLDEPGPDADAE